MAVYDGPLPGAGQFGLYQVGLQKAFDDAHAQIQSQRGQFLSQQGIGAIGADGTFQINANSPTGAYQQMAQGNALQRSADAADLSASGFSGGGILAQSREQAQSAYSQNAANWAMNAVQRTNDLNQQDVQNTQQYGSDFYNGLLNDVQSAIAAGTYNPADYTGIKLPDGTVFNAPPLGTGTTGTGGGGTAGGGFTPPPTGGGGQQGALGTINGKTVWGYGLQGTPFFSRAQAVAHGRLGKKKGQK